MNDTKPSWDKCRALVAGMLEQEKGKPTMIGRLGGGCRCVVDMGKMRWVTVMDEYTCDGCREMNGKRVTDERPPLHDCGNEPSTGVKTNPADW